MIFKIVVEHSDPLVVEILVNPDFVAGIVFTPTYQDPGFSSESKAHYQLHLVGSPPVYFPADAKGAKELWEELERRKNA